MLILFSVGLWFYLFPHLSLHKLISDKLFIIYLIALVLTTASGNIINDIYDIETDKINKPQKVWIPHFLSKKSAWILYVFLIVISLLLGFYISYFSKFPIYFFVNLIVIILLFFYAKKIKKMLIFNNLLIAFLIAFSMFFLFVFVKEFSNYTDENIFNSEIYEMGIFLITFAFGLNWIREIVKDVEDRVGDKATGVQTFATEFSLEQVKIILLILTMLLVIYLMIVAVKNWQNEIIFSIYLIFAVGMSLLLFVKQLLIAKSENDFTKISKLLKLIMLIGFLSIFLIQN